MIRLQKVITACLHLVFESALVIALLISALIWSSCEDELIDHHEGDLAVLQDIIDLNNLQSREPMLVDLNGNGEMDGSEPFDDLNGNGIWDTAEPFDDLNDNGIRDEAESFEYMVDLVYETSSEMHWYYDKMFKLYYQSDLSMRDISKGSKISLKNIFDTIKKTRNYVKEKLKEEYEDYQNKDYDYLQRGGGHDRENN